MFRTRVLFNISTKFEQKWTHPGMFDISKYHASVKQQTEEPISESTINQRVI